MVIYKYGRSVFLGNLPIVNPFSRYNPRPFLHRYFHFEPDVDSEKLVKEGLIRW